MSNCVKCGRPLGGGEKFCAGCGQPVQAQELKGKNCPECGTACEAGATFCLHCGHRFAPAAAAEEARKTCGHCGASFPTTMQNCPLCGHPANAPAYAPAQSPYALPYGRVRNRDNTYLALAKAWRIVAIVFWVLGGIGAFAAAATNQEYLTGTASGVVFLPSAVSVALIGFVCFSVSYLINLLVDIKNKK